MQVVIEIPEDFYYKAKRGFFELFDIREVRDAIANGLPLNSEKDKSVEEGTPQKYKLAENLNIVFMLERDRGVQSDEIVMRMITTDEKGKRTRQDVMLSAEEAKALRKGLKQQIMRSKEEKREEGDD